MVIFLTVNAGSGEAQVSCYRCVNDLYRLLCSLFNGLH